ncbi:hypothetical protein [Bosea sp. NBC_00550]|uniref:hypothetical protein n=1 Tax=Bosea sp. NBC_00550 TaxID=2969621 RepID=UPI002230E3DF|nr:hypothetical protein [Bosea sp. NBC_00550]UZF95653.1 hypothetical protein NWE53_29820 [Bosea sp. NBC_00550]
MSNDPDVVIAKALNAGLRRLLSVAIRQANEDGSGGRRSTLRHELDSEIERLVVRSHNNDDPELTMAVRNGLKLLVDAADREAADA